MEKMTKLSEEEDASMLGKRRKVTFDVSLASHDDESLSNADKFERDTKSETVSEEHEFVDMPGAEDKVKRTIDQIYEYIDNLRVRISGSEKPLPKDFINISFYGNRLVRFDEIKADCYPFSLLPAEVLQHVTGCQPFEWESNRSAFIVFGYTEIAKTFLHRYDGLKIPGTEITYRLSWAPFAPFDNSIEEHPDVSEKENIEKEVQIDTHKDDKVNEKLQYDEELELKIEEFHKELAGQYSWSWPEHKQEEVTPFAANSDSNILYLGMVDPNVTEEDMRFIFEGQWECSVSLGEGWGFVEFKHSESALIALETLRAKLEEQKICCLLWGSKTIEVKSDEDSDAEDSEL